VKLVAEFFDARLVHPERLTLELIDDAERDCPEAMAVPYLALASRSGDTVALRDQLGGEMLHVRPRLVINTTGAWVDQVDGHLGVKHRLIGGTRGSHLVLRHRRLAHELGARMLYFETRDHRICLAYGLTPDLVLLGTTDIRTDDPDDCQCTEAEIDYLFKELREALPQIAVTRDQIVFSYAGVRPLPAADGTVAGAISRDHSLNVMPRDGSRPFDILTLVGGKWTTYRACAAQITDVVLARMGRHRSVDTASLPIGGGRDCPADARARAARVKSLGVASGLAPQLAAALWDRYGCDADSVAAFLATSSPAPITDLPSYTVGEMRYIARHQRVGRLADVVLRRTLIAIEGRCTEGALRMIAKVIGDELGWDAPRIAHEVADTVQVLRQRHGVEVGNVHTDQSPRA
jgi:glycerol-3-phosphate dehydrogenase